MPFATQNDFPSQPADVQVLFTGLLLLVPQDDGSCFVAVHNTSCTAHRLSIIVRRKDSNVEIERPAANLTITVEPFRNQVVTKFGFGDFTRSEHDDDPRDIGWAIDFRAVHGPVCGLQPGTRPRIRLTDGLLHCFQRTDPAMLRVELLEPHRPPAPLNRIAATIGANIYLAANEQVVLRWNDASGAREFRLPEADNPGTGYVIEIDNGPVNPADLHNDFQEYYRILSGVPEAARRDLLLNGFQSVTCDPVTGALTSGAEDIFTAGVDAPCMSGLLDGGI